MNNMQIKKAILENLRLKETGLEQGSRTERLTVDRLTMDAEKDMKTAREAMPGMTRAEAWAMVRDQYLTAPEIPVQAPRRPTS